ncbi:MAG TPA: c-type cytochrome biogenesis protein CcsB [Nocardioides sp.]
MTDIQWESLSNQAVTVCGIVYFLALLAHSAQWAGLRKLPADETPSTGQVATFGRFGVLLTVLAVAAHGVGLVARGMAADPNRVPWGNMYEFTLSATFVAALGYLLLYRRYSLSWLSPWLVGFVFVILMMDVLWLHEPVAPLTESLNSSPWLVIHVVSAVLATGVFSLGGLVSILFLVKARAEARDAARVAVPARELVGIGGTGSAAESGSASAPQRGIIARIPSSDSLDRLAYRLHAFAFPVWTFAVLISGPIWAHQAWSRYWGWDPKEVWAFITWVVCAAYLHARATAGWKGRNASIVALVGLGTLMFNFIGINYFFGGSSQHSYAAPEQAVHGPAVAGESLSAEPAGPVHSPLPG